MKIKFFIKLHPINRHGYSSTILLDQEDVPDGLKKGRLWCKDSNNIYVTLVKDKKNAYYHLNLNDKVLTYEELYHKLELDLICSVNLELSV